MILETNNHSIFKLNYHLVLVTKYRRKVVNDTISMRLKQIFERIGEKYLKRMCKSQHNNVKKRENKNVQKNN